MKTILPLLGGILFTIVPASAQTLRYTHWPPYLALTTYSKRQPDAFTSNPASLSRLKDFSAGLFAERRFMLAPVAGYTIAAVFPTRLGNLGLRLGYHGFKNFNDNRAGLAYARSLGKRLDIGIQFNYQGYRVPGYGNTGYFDADLGLLLHLSTRFHMGTHIANLLAASATARTNDKRAALFSAGAGYDVSDQFFAGVTVYKETLKPVTVLAGVQYNFRQQFFFRAGVETASASPFAGAGVCWHKLRLDISVSHHPQLGFSPSLLLIYAPQPVQL